MSNPDVTPLLNLGSTIPIGSYIVGFLNDGTASSPNWIDTANSGAIFEDGDGGGHGGEAGTVPEPSSFVLFGSAGLGLAFFLRKKGRRRA